MAWYDDNWLIAAATLLGVAIFYRQLRSMAKKNEFDALMNAKDTFPRRFAHLENGAADFYALKDQFAGVDGGRDGDTRWGERCYRERLAARVEVVAKLPEAERKEHIDSIIKPFVDSLNNFAEFIDFKFIDPQRVLSKYHLAMARELFIAEPYIYYTVLNPESGRWAYRVLRLGEMARSYNDMNPVHRRSIYYMHGARPDREFGVIYPAPRSALLPLLKLIWLVRRAVVGYPTISARVKRRQNRRVMALGELLTDPETVPVG